jgi:hypothetical protein
MAAKKLVFQHKFQTFAPGFSRLRRLNAQQIRNPFYCMNDVGCRFLQSAFFRFQQK